MPRIPQKPSGHQQGSLRAGKCWEGCTKLSQCPQTQLLLQGTECFSSLLVKILGLVPEVLGFCPTLSPLMKWVHKEGPQGLLRVCSGGSVLGEVGGFLQILMSGVSQGKSWNGRSLSNKGALSPQQLGWQSSDFSFFQTSLSAQCSPTLNRFLQHWSQSQIFTQPFFNT